MPVTTVLGHQRETDSSRYEAGSISDRFDRNTLLIGCVGEGKKVLELGCSTGYISARLQRAGCSVHAVELDQGAAECARRFCQQVVVADLGQAGWEVAISEVGFDVIIMGDVLEHLVDPDSVLRRANSLLAPNGRVVISLPNIVHWTQRMKVLLGHFEYGPIGLLDFTHLRFFTVKTARSLIEGAGCRIVSFQPIIGGRFTEYFRRGWQILASLFPGLFAYQLLFVAEPQRMRANAEVGVGFES